jgi:hypothetical protein
VSVGDLTADRRDDRVTLKFHSATARRPAGPTIAPVERVEIYGDVDGADRADARAGRVLDPKNLLTTVAVKPQPPLSRSGGKSSTENPRRTGARRLRPDPRPGLGGTPATFVETVPADAIAAGMTRYYVALALVRTPAQSEFARGSVPLRAHAGRAVRASRSKTTSRR